MKKLGFFLLALICSLQLSAQFKVEATSESFDEPEVGAAKIIKAENGNTYFLHFTKRGALSVKCYDARRKLSFQKETKYDAVSREVGEVKGAYIFNNQICFFIYIIHRRVPSLMRVILNATTGELVEQKTIATLDKVTYGDNYALYYGKVPFPNIYVRKDAHSNNYAVALFNSLTGDRNKRIEVLFYNDKHELISKAFYTAPDNGFKYMEFFDLYVDGSQSVYVVSKGFNTERSGGNQSGGLFVGKLTAGSATFDMVKTPFLGAKDIKAIIFRFNEVTQQFLMSITKGNTQTGKGSRVFLATMDKNLENYAEKQLDFSQLDQIARKEYKKKERMDATPTALYINKDGSFTIVLEEQLIVVSTTVSSKGQTRSRSSYYLNDIGVVHYNKDGEEIGANYIPKSQSTKRLNPPIFYSFRSEMAYELKDGYQYRSFEYLHGPNNNYIMFNDIASNQEKIQAGIKVKTIVTLGDCNGYFYTIDKKGIPKGELLLQNKSEEERHLILFNVSYFDEVNNEYIVLDRVLEGREKSANNSLAKARVKYRHEPENLSIT